MSIRPERPEDTAAIADITAAAFAPMAYSSGTEPAIIAGLRAAGALTLSLVAECDGDLVGHVAFSPVRINGAPGRWHGLGPVAVRPDLQRQGIGAALIREGLQRLTDLGAEGCVVLGDPAYYGGFGFRHDPQLSYPCPYPQAFQRLVLQGPAPTGTVAYHAAFAAT